ncbi:MAG: ABC transporter [Candidatus Coatesbacteria bacterium RBG_13_66_14]|uniref:ABC transporter n=1 Tax=Candidatus Coatesbacteria bacterium RBG_13_66_14 TaxID=1817816 RepID=A0A1F5F4M7_9BACT|nr:MAG: ABC transporter [Candidatus Coatesbacteria bacterium RBG_13_66_14]
METRGLTKFYSKTRGIEDVDLAVEPGEIFGFIGPNGAGKSTTIRTLLSLLRPTRGEGRIFGLDIVRDSKAIKRRVGYLPAEVNYYDRLRVGELLAYSARFYGVEDGGRTRELAERFNVDLERDFSDLSLGNKKKVAVLAALLHSPELLILDEPTGGLDPLVQARLTETLREENARGTTVFYSSHVLSEVQKICGRVAILKGGRVVGVEEISSLRRKQLKRVRLSLAKPPEPGAFDIDGVHDLEVKDRDCRFLFDGRPGDLLALLAGMPVTDVTLEEPDLEEIFLHFYREGGEG